MRVIVAIIGGLILALGNRACFAQTKSQRDTVWVVQLAPNQKIQPENCHLATFDGNKRPIVVRANDTLMHLETFVEAELPILEAPCFLPTLKIIFRHYTYVLSPYCGVIVKLKNDLPYRPTAFQLANDFIFTEGLVSYFNRLEARYFSKTNKAYFEQIKDSIPSAIKLYGTSNDALDGNENDAFDDAFDDDLAKEIAKDVPAPRTNERNNEALELRNIEEILENVPDEDEENSFENEIDEKDKDNEPEPETTPTDLNLDFDDFKPANPKPKQQQQQPPNHTKPKRP